MFGQTLLCEENPIFCVEWFSQKNISEISKTGRKGLKLIWKKGEKD